MSTENRLSIPNFDFETVNKENPLSQITKLGKSLALKLLPISKKLPVGQEFVFWELDIYNKYFFTDEGLDNADNFLLTAGDFGICKIYCTEFPENPNDFYLKIWGYATMSSELRTFDASELSFKFKKTKAGLKFDGFELIGQANHQFYTYAFDISDISRLEAFLIADKALNLFSNHSLLPDKI